jgi:HPt (histidine-containing phosphotransfer) domain-containing protein
MVTFRDPSTVSELPAASDKTAVRTKLSGKDRRVLIESVTRDLESIDDAWRRHDQASLLDRIHSLKGALFIVGEHATANDCGVAEQSVHAQGMDKCDRDIEQLKQSLRHLLERYADHG